MIPGMDREREQLWYSAAWLARWRDGITDAVRSMTASFEETHGRAPGGNEVRAAGAEDLRAARDYDREPVRCDGMVTFYESVAEVALPDVGNGFFMPPAGECLRRFREEGPVFVPSADDPFGLVIASNGDGLFYVADWGGVVHRSRSSSLDDEDFDKYADSVPEFLSHVRRHVTAFARTGAAGDL